MHGGMNHLLFDSKDSSGGRAHFWPTKAHLGNRQTANLEKHPIKPPLSLKRANQQVLSSGEYHYGRSRRHTCFESLIFGHKVTSPKSAEGVVGGGVLKG